MKKTVDKMMRIVRADTGGSKIYADMLLSMLPNSISKNLKKPPDKLGFRKNYFAFFACHFLSCEPPNRQTSGISARS